MRHIVLRRVDSAGTPESPQAIAMEAGASHPAIAAGNETLVAAWSATGGAPDQSVIRVRVIRTR
jgi:hypothetical protein